MGGRRRVRALGAVVIAALAVASAAQLAGGAAIASTTAVPKAMVGCWHRHVPGVPGLTGPGVWLMRIKSGELLAYTPGTRKCAGQPDFTATVAAAGSHLTIGSVPVCRTKGLYTWRASANRLTLQAKADKSCAPRRLLFSGVWKKT